MVLGLSINCEALAPQEWSWLRGTGRAVRIYTGNKKKPYWDVLPEFEMAPHNTLERALIRRNQFGKLG